MCYNCAGGETANVFEMSEQLMHEAKAWSKTKENRSLGGFTMSGDISRYF
jgi:hypothetical protein